jgi:replicative DNA helicase
MEKIILFHCLTNEAYLTSVIDFLTPDLFDNKNNRDIIDIISNFHDRNKTCPNITEVKALLTTDELKSSFKKVVEEFTHLDKKYNAEELERNTEQFIKEKGVYNTLLETAKMVSEGGADTELILNKFEKACNINLTTDHGIELYSDIDRIVDDLNKTDPVISSGWEWMDKILGGGFKRDGRAIYIYAGRPNVGKSIFLGNIANNISASGHNVLVISLEMSEMVYARRLCSNATAIPLSELQFSSETLRRDMLKIKANNPKRRIYIKEFPPSTITPKQISGFIKKLHNSGIKFDAIVIDYLNLLNSPAGANLYERVKYITEQLRAMTYIFNCPIITATQLNRGSFNEASPGLDGLSESVGVAATADFIMGLWQDDEDIEFQTIHAGIMKNRFGRAVGTKRFGIDYTTLTLSEFDEETISNTDEANEVYNTLRMLTDS